VLHHTTTPSSHAVPRRKPSSFGATPVGTGFLAAGGGGGHADPVSEPSPPV